MNINRFCLFSVTLLACISASYGAQPTTPNNERTPLRVQPAMIVDQTGFGGPVAAATLFIPHGWKTQGGVEWGQQHTCVNGYALNWSARDASGARGVVALPQQGWQWTPQGGGVGTCPQAQIDNAADYIRAIMKQIDPNAREISARNRPDLEKEAAAHTGVTDDGFQRITKHASAAEVTFQFTQNGQQLQGTLLTTVLITHMITGGQYAAPLHTWSAYAAPTFGSFGPVGEHTPGMYEALRKSIMYNPQWEQLIARHNAKMDRIALQGFIERNKIINQANQDINKILNDTWRAQQKSSDERAREFLEYIRDVETYADPNAPGGSVELSSFYNHAWALEDGTYVLTDDPSFQPYSVFGISGEPLSPLP